MNPSLPACWLETVRLHGRKVALIEASTGTRCTFQQLNDRADAWARDHGASIPPGLEGRSVAFSVPNGIRWFELMLGLLKLGAIPVPLDAAEPVDSQKNLAKLLRSVARWENDRLVPVQHGSGGAKRHRTTRPCLIKLTSGSTGSPRPLLFSHDEMIADARQVMSSMGITSEDRNHALIPFGHSYGLGNLTLPLMMAGVSVVCGTSPFPHAIAADLRQWKSTIFPAVPAILRALAGADGIRLGRLRLIISAGAPLPVETAGAFRQRYGRSIHSFYGSSETGGISFDRDGRATLEGSVGTAMDGVTLTRLGTDRLRVSSPAVFTAGNRRKHNRHGAWVMADRVRIGADRTIRLLGRRGTTVKIAGRRVELAETAAAIKRLPGVDDAWVAVGGADEQVIGAAVASRRASAELRDALGGILSGWKIPRKWLVLSALPQTERGKPDSRALNSALFGPTSPR